MIGQAIKNFTIKKGDKTFEIKAGQIITLPDDKAGVLLVKGMIKSYSALDIKALPKMPLRNFEKAGLCLKINSQVLGETVYFLSNEKAIRDLPEGATYYTAKELQALIDQKVQPDSLKLIHTAKKIFPGAILSEPPKALNIKKR